MENWNKWQPFTNNLGKMYIEKVIISDNATEVILSNELENNVYKFFFNGEILSIRSSDEGKRIKLFNKLDQIYGLNFFKDWTFFTIKDSEYIKWFNKETYNIYSHYNIIHYVFMGSNNIVEILSTFSPTICID